jgi:hypothetical protein
MASIQDGGDCVTARAARNVQLNIWRVYAQEREFKGIKNS